MQMDTQNGITAFFCLEDGPKFILNMVLLCRCFLSDIKHERRLGSKGHGEVTSLALLPPNLDFLGTFEWTTHADAKFSIASLCT